ncbi:MAG TPA: sigma-70 family RNA polymerase sigma factor [Blastocatellia bacterium]|nr:sigma-70 family RNA polymerase sigma factor [Blastocatellia bacterium]
MDEAADNLAFAAVEPCSLAAHETTDESLIARVRAGDEAAFEQLFERHRLRVARVVGRFFNRPEKVEEIAQEVFTKLYFALGSYASQRGATFATWLTRVAINACYDELRRARRRQEGRMSSISGEEAAWLGARLRDGRAGRNAETEMISRDLAQKLLARLNPEDRLVLTLLDAENLSVAEIAELVGWSVSRVKVRAHRARLALRRVLKEFL